MKNVKTGKIIVISAPSGAGKSTICNAMIENFKNLVYSISATTRAPRKGEKDAREYFFISKEKFEKMLKQKAFAEWAKVHDNYYGTPKALLQKTINSGKNVLLDIDVCGAMQIKKCFPQACLIFIKAPSLKILKERLIKRGQDSPETIKIRLANAKAENTFIDKYDFVVVNDVLEESIFAVKTIIQALKYKVEKEI
ncbi:MAG: guanylate kinase [Elusimicrobiota bacterium]|jgi:guanylate kinase|nr:guanylate kinase [Elusimicrobiota bacterium]